MFSGPSCREKEVCLKHCNILEVSLPAEFYNIEYRVYYYNSNYIFLPTTSKWLLPRKIIGQLECRPKENNKRLRRDGLCWSKIARMRLPRNVVKSKQNSSTYTWCIRKHSERLWKKPFARLFQNLTAFSIFKLWSIPLGSESFKPILEASRSRIFDLKLWFSKKIIFLSPTTHFIRNSLTKSASKLEKNSKKWIFFDFFKMDLGSIYDHVRVPNHFGTSKTPFGSILMHFEAILETFSKSNFRPWKVDFELVMLYQPLEQAICGAVSKPKGFFNFQHMINPSRIEKLQTNPRGL